MAYWLFKADPGTYGLADLQRDKRTTWDGVSNNLALKHLRECKKGDEVLIYHTGDEKAVVGIAEVLKESYPDPKQKDPKLAVVDLKFVRKLAKPVTLADIKADKDFEQFLLVRMPRLSVMPVTGQQWKLILKMSGA